MIEDCPFCIGEQVKNPEGHVLTVVSIYEDNDFIEEDEPTVHIECNDGWAYTEDNLVKYDPDAEENESESGKPEQV